MKNGTPVLIVFSEFSIKKDIPEINTAALSSIPVASSKKPELEDIDIHIETKEEYERVLAKPHDTEKTSSESGFFSSEPTDLGDTDASMIDRIIGGDDK